MERDAAASFFYGVNFFNAREYKIDLILSGFNQLQKESKLVQEESMKVLAGFEKIRDED